MTETPGSSTSVERVLAVEDDPVLLRASQVVLEHAGYDVTSYFVI